VHAWWLEGDDADGGGDAPLLSFRPFGDGAGAGAVARVNFLGAAGPNGGGGYMWTGHNAGGYGWGAGGPGGIDAGDAAAPAAGLLVPLAYGATHDVWGGGGGGGGGGGLWGGGGGSVPLFAVRGTPGAGGSSYAPGAGASVRLAGNGGAVGAAGGAGAVSFVCVAPSPSSTATASTLPSATPSPSPSPSPSRSP
jgi:hypothetical protein